MKYIDTYINIANDNIIIVSKTKSCKFVFSIYLYNSIYLYKFVEKFFSSKFNKNSFGTISLNVYKIDEQGQYKTEFKDVICSLIFKNNQFKLDILKFNYLPNNPLNEITQQTLFQQYMNICNINKTFHQIFLTYIIMRNGI